MEEEFSIGRIESSDQRRNSLGLCMGLTIFGLLIFAFGIFILFFAIQNKKNGFIDSYHFMLNLSIGFFVFGTIIIVIGWLNRLIQILGYKKIYKNGEYLVVDVLQLTHSRGIYGESMQYGIMYNIYNQLRMSKFYIYKRNQAMQIIDNKKMKIIYNKDIDKVLYLKCKYALEI